MAKYGGNFVRPLGRLETMYYMYYKQGMGNFVQLVSLRCVQCVQLSEVLKAMEILHFQHPVLRMFIRETEECAQFQFVEMNPVRIDCRVSSLPPEDLLQEELGTNFDSSGPLWRITVQRIQNAEQKNADICSGCRKHGDGFRHKFSFALTFHHSLIDGVYMLYLLADFVELLDKVQKNQISANDIRCRILPSPVEHYMLAIPRTETSAATPTLCAASTPLEALTAYKKRFVHEINRLGSNPVQAMVVRTKMVQTNTQKFLSECKRQGILVSGAIMAASCIAFAKQVELAVCSQVKVLEIPIEVMVVMPYVLCISNLSTFDRIVRPGLEPRFQLEETPGLFLTGIDSQPIFEITVFSILGQFHISTSYCNQYTSRETAARFSWTTTKTIQNTNML